MEEQHFPAEPVLEVRPQHVPHLSELGEHQGPFPFGHDLLQHLLQSLQLARAPRHRRAIVQQLGRVVADLLELHHGRQDQTPPFHPVGAGDAIEHVVDHRLVQGGLLSGQVAEHQATTAFLQPAAQAEEGPECRAEHVVYLLETDDDALPALIADYRQQLLAQRVSHFVPAQLGLIQCDNENAVDRFEADVLVTCFRHDQLHRSLGSEHAAFTCRGPIYKSSDTNTNRKNSVAAETFRVRAFARHLKIRAASSFGSIIFLLAA